ncbi:alpha-(1,3)-fucosyltransferase 7-like isoform X2 [Sardina pilchardus]
MRIRHSYRWMPVVVLLICLSVYLLIQKPKQVVISKSTKTTILLWYWPFGVKDYSENDLCHERFGIRNCMLVDNQSQFYDADFVIFHHYELGNRQQKLPLNLIRPQKQRWVWFSQESPENNLNVKSLAGYFNYTMYYRRDADIYAPYGRMIEKKDLGTEVKVKDLIPKRKTHLACWVVSSFLPNHKRTAVYQKLSNVIPIVVYGGAVNNSLNSDSLLQTISHCYFYLAFENSIFRDYITEKFWYNAFMGGAVPVVLGPPREQYEAVAPKDSFIHVDDFSSIEELGEFLKKLIVDKERYASYFNWKLKYKVLTNYWIKHLCESCPRFSSLQTPKIYKDLDAWLWDKA